MKKTAASLLISLVAVTLMCFSPSAGARNGRGYHSPSHVSGYHRSNGTYVAPHYRSGRDGYHNNNWSVRGNVNPYTGRAGTKNRW
jgi:hypothetical protein